MLAVALAFATHAGATIDPSVVDAILSRPGWSDDCIEVARDLMVCDEPALALKVLNKYRPSINRGFYERYLNDGNAKGALEVLENYRVELPQPIQDLCYYRDDAHIKGAVEYTRQADKQHENAGLISPTQRQSLDLDPTAPQVLDLCVFLANARLPKLAAKVFKGYVDPAMYGGNTEIAKDLLYWSGEDADIDVYFPKGLSVLSTHYLVGQASELKSKAFEDAALSALMVRDIAPPDTDETDEIYFDMMFVLRQAAEQGRISEVRRVVDRCSDGIIDLLCKHGWSRDFVCASVLVKIGRPQILERAAKRLWARAEPEFKKRLAEAPQSVNTEGVTTAAMLFAFAGEMEKAENAIALAKTSHSYQFRSTVYFLADRYVQIGDYEEAIDAYASDGPYNGPEITSVGVMQIDRASDVGTKRTLAKRLVDKYLGAHSKGGLDDLTVILVPLGMKQDLRRVLDAQFLNPPKATSRDENAFFAYLAVGDPVSASKFSYVNADNAAEWVIPLLRKWDSKFLGPVEQLLDIGGQNLFEMGIAGLSKKTNGRADLVETYFNVLEAVRSSQEMTDRVLTALDAYLQSLPVIGKDATLLKTLTSLVPYEKTDVLDVSTQRHIVESVMRAAGAATPAQSYR